MHSTTQATQSLSGNTFLMVTYMLSASYVYALHTEWHTGPRIHCKRKHILALALSQLGTRLYLFTPWRSDV